MLTYNTIKQYTVEIQNLLKDFPLLPNVRPSPQLDFGDKEKQYVAKSRVVLQQSSGQSDWVFITFWRNAITKSDESHSNRRFSTYSDVEVDNSVEKFKTANVTVPTIIRIYSSSYHLLELIEEVLYLFPIDVMIVSHADPIGDVSVSIKREDIEVSEVLGFEENGPISYLQYTAQITFPLVMSLNKVASIITEVQGNLYIE